MKNNYELQFKNCTNVAQPCAFTLCKAAKKNKLWLTALVLIIHSSYLITNVNAQNNVGIGTTTPNPKAILELNANNKGFLAPRMNTTFMNAIAPTATESALLIYNTDSACYHFYNGLAWKNLCQKGMDTAVINKAIKNYLGGVSFTTVINNMLVDSSVTNYATINNAIVNNITIDSSVINYTTINNAVINNLTVDSSYTKISNSNISNINIANIDTNITNVATINNATINVLKVDSSVTNYSNINNLAVDSSITNYANINNAVIDSLQSNYINATTGNFTTLNVGGQSINNLMTDSIKSQAWLLKGNTATNSNTNFMGTVDNTSLRIRTNNTERMIVDSLGNVGIGTTIPVAKLEVFSFGNARVRDVAEGGFSGVEACTYRSSSLSGHPYFMGYFANGTKASPTYPLVGETLSAFLGRDAIDGNSSGYGGASIYMTSAENFSATNKGTFMSFSTTPIGANAPLEQVRIAHNGNVGIGTSSPLSLLHLNGNYPLIMQGTIKSWLLGSSNTGDDFNIWDDGLGAGTANTFRIDNNRNIITSLNGGNVGIGTTSPTNKLEVMGNIMATNGALLSNVTSGKGLEGLVDLRGIRATSSRPNLNSWTLYNMNEYGGAESGLSIWEYYDNDNNGAFCNPGDICQPRFHIQNVTGNVGIGTISPTSKLEIQGDIKIVDGTQGANKVLTSDAAGKASWQAASSGGVPIGSIQAWAKSMPGTPALPAGWVECNGAVLSDVASPYNGQTIPNLNGTSRFLQGATTSGGTGGAATHSHTFTQTGADYAPDASHFTDGSIANPSSNIPPFFNVVWIMRVK